MLYEIFPINNNGLPVKKEEKRLFELIRLYIMRANPRVISGSPSALIIKPLVPK
jgi:hypothetical protein